MLRHPFRAAIIAAAIVALGAVSAMAGNNTFFTSIGDLVFPFTPPSNAGATPGTIDNMTIGAATPAGATFGAIHLDNGTKTATAVAGAATLNKDAGIITSEAITTAAGATYTLTLTDLSIAVGDQVMASVNLGAGTGGTPTIATVTPAAGSVKIVVQNIHATVAFNAAIQIAFVVFKN